jgi:ribosomal protein S6
MMLYETLILSVPEITNDETKQLEKQLDTILQKNKSAKVSFERWGKYKLAQPVNKNNYGVYFLARFEVEQANMENLLTEMSEYLTLKAANVVMRFMNTVLDPKKGLNYAKPNPLDESARDLDKFLKDNKMDGLIANKTTGKDSEELEACEEGDHCHEEA